MTDIHDKAIEAAARALSGLSEEEWDAYDPDTKEYERADARAAIAAYEAAMWQPVETAPSDGTPFDIWPRPDGLGWYRHGKKELPTFWFDGYEEDRTSYDATHWRPLPHQPGGSGDD